MFGGLKKVVFLQPQIERFSVAKRGALAQLARALAWHARGHRFDSVMLHKQKTSPIGEVFCFQFLQSPLQHLVHWGIYRIEALVIEEIAGDIGFQ